MAQDQDGVFWIIEGKSDQGKDDVVVQKKREAAVDLVNELDERVKLFVCGA